MPRQSGQVRGTALTRIGGTTALSRRVNAGIAAPRGPRRQCGRAQGLHDRPDGQRCGIGSGSETRQDVCDNAVAVHACKLEDFPLREINLLRQRLAQHTLGAKVPGPDRFLWNGERVGIWRSPESGTLASTSVFESELTMGIMFSRSSRAPPSGTTFVQHQSGEPRGKGGGSAKLSDGPVGTEVRIL